MVAVAWEKNMSDSEVCASDYEVDLGVLPAVTYVGAHVTVGEADKKVHVIQVQHGEELLQHLQSARMATKVQNLGVEGDLMKIGLTPCTRSEQRTVCEAISDFYGGLQARCLLEKFGRGISPEDLISDNDLTYVYLEEAEQGFGPRYDMLKETGRLSQSSTTGASSPQLYAVIRKLGLMNRRVCDIGSGKGLALLVFDLFPQKALSGVEMSPNMVKMSQSYMGSVHADHVKIHEASALDFAYPADIDLFYVYNPFSAKIFCGVLERIKACGCGSADMLLYNAPLAYEEELLRMGYARHVQIPTAERCFQLWKGVQNSENPASPKGKESGDVSTTQARSGQEEPKPSRFTVKTYDEGLASEWDTFVLSDSTANGTIWHTRKFLSYHDVAKFTDSSILLMETKSGTLLACFAACRMRDGSYWSHMGTSYGGPVVSKSLCGTKDIDEVLATILDHYKYSVSMRISEHFFSEVGVADSLVYVLCQKGLRVKPEIGVYRKLPVESEQQVSDAFNKRTRTYMRKALATGCYSTEVFHEEDAGRMPYAAFHDIVVENLKKHGTQPTHTREELLRLVGILGPGFQCLVTVWHEDKATKEKTMVAGTWVIKNRRAWHSFYISKLYRTASPVDAITQVLALHDAMCLAVKNNIDYYNFGVCTERRGEYCNMGLITFKESLGGVCTNRYVFEAAPQTALAKPSLPES